MTASERVLHRAGYGAALQCTLERSIVDFVDLKTVTKGLVEEEVVEEVGSEVGEAALVSVPPSDG